MIEFQKFQMPTASSRRWSDVASPGGSIWSRDFQPVCHSKSKLSNAASPRRPSQSSEEERVTSRRTPCRELQVKRPREGTLAEQFIQRQDIRVVGGRRTKKTHGEHGGNPVDPQSSRCEVATTEAALAPVLSCLFLSFRI